MYTILDFAGKTMSLAKAHGFEKFFGVLTYGVHSFDLRDRTLSSGSDQTDITKQHIDSLSGPHIRAAFSEKWSAALASKKNNPCLNSVWISQEALISDIDISEVIRFSGMKTKFNAPGIKFDLKDPKYAIGKIWPFQESVFQAITL